MEGYLAQPIYRREGLGPSPKQRALPSLRSGWGIGLEKRWREWEEKKEWELDLYAK